MPKVYLSLNAITNTKPASPFWMLRLCVWMQSYHWKTMLHGVETKPVWVLSVLLCLPHTRWQRYPGGISSCRPHCAALALFEFSLELSLSPKLQHRPACAKKIWKKEPQADHHEQPQKWWKYARLHVTGLWLQSTRPHGALGQWTMRSCSSCWSSTLIISSEDCPCSWIALNYVAP